MDDLGVHWHNDRDVGPDAGSLISYPSDRPTTSQRSAVGPDRRIGAVTPDEERWAEALAIERLHDADASRWIADRIDVLGTVGDQAGVIRFREIATRYDRLRGGSVS